MRKPRRCSASGTSWAAFHGRLEQPTTASTLRTLEDLGGSEPGPRHRSDGHQATLRASRSRADIGRGASWPGLTPAAMPRPPRRDDRRPEEADRHHRPADRGERCRLTELRDEMDPPHPEPGSGGGAGAPASRVPGRRRAPRGDPRPSPARPPVRRAGSPGSTRAAAGRTPASWTGATPSWAASVTPTASASGRGPGRAAANGPASTTMPAVAPTESHHPTDQTSSGSSSSRPVTARASNRTLDAGRARNTDVAASPAMTEARRTEGSKRVSSANHAMSASVPSQRASEPQPLEPGTGHEQQERDVLARNGREVRESGLAEGHDAPRRTGCGRRPARSRGTGTGRCAAAPGRPPRWCAGCGSRPCWRRRRVTSPSPCRRGPGPARAGGPGAPRSPGTAVRSGR